MSITLGRKTQAKVLRRSRAGEYKRVKTSFMTDEGPATGTIWNYPAGKDRVGWEVARVTKRYIYFENVSWLGKQRRGSLAGFIADVNAGKLILIGVRADYTPARTEY